MKTIFKKKEEETMRDVLTLSMKGAKVTAALVVFLLLISCLTAEGTLFVGLEGSSPATFTTDMTGFPNVTWTSGYSFDVSGAAATPDGTIYLCEGAFTTHLYQATLTSAPQLLCTISEDMSALAYGNDTLYGFSNYADPKGIIVLIRQVEQQLWCWMFTPVPAFVFLLWILILKMDCFMATPNTVLPDFIPLI